MNYLLPLPRLPRHICLAAIGLTLAATLNGVSAMPAKLPASEWVKRIASVSKPLPFSMTIGGRGIRDLLPAWEVRTKAAKGPDGRSVRTTTWSDPATGLRLTREMTQFPGYPAVDWVLRIENTGKADSPLIEDVLPLDAEISAPLPGANPYVLHRTNGAPANATDFEPRTVQLPPGATESLGGGGGRSSNRDFPFFKIEAADGSRIIAVGWSGQWAARVECDEDRRLRFTAGMERTHFVLHPGESVRTPRILILHTSGDTLEGNARFRELIQKFYAAKRSGKTPEPTLFCNTCFTRGGGWLNECNAENQISLIKAYAPLGLEALITDAGWFEGGWPDGAGNWTPRKDAYPDGMRPVAAAARDNGLIYGLWFEPERVVKGTGLFKDHRDWILSDGSPEQGSFLADFGRKEVQDYFFDIVSGFMALPGFRVYRQDFNMDPLPNWRHTDAPDRQGISEIRYVEGLYAYWDRIAAAFPDSLREECASGGRRIDIETIQRMHLHQSTDYWFNDNVNQARCWGYSQYLPNGVVTDPVNSLEPYSVYSAFASSLCLGWIADDPGFDAALARGYTERYRALRHLLIGAWYPLLPYSRELDAWMASQYHRADLDEGMIVAFRHSDSPRDTMEVRLHGLSPTAKYEITPDGAAGFTRVSGKSLAAGFDLTIPAKPGFSLITYKRIPAKP
ncbi:MAG TPA: alpha-galactosidase [Armatimonadota bacterium]|jgi:alpha-galactosidase